MSDSNAVDLAILGVLNDAALSGLMPGGVFFDLAPAGVSQFVIVTLDSHEDSYQFAEPAFERFVYRITAVEKAAADESGELARQRIHELLQDVPLTIPGYAHAATRRLSYVRLTELDEVDRANRWQHRGGRYEVIVAPVLEGAARGVPPGMVFSETE